MDITSSGPEVVKACLHRTTPKLTYEPTTEKCYYLGVAKCETVGPFLDPIKCT